MKNTFITLMILFAGAAIGQVFDLPPQTVLDFPLQNRDAGIPFDIDEDGDLDILFKDDSEDVLRWYHNDGDFNFTFTNISSSFTGLPLDIADLNGDAKADVLTTQGWFLNDGTGQFDNFTAAADVIRRFGDIDMDGDLDYVSRFNGEEGRIHLNNGDGTFEVEIFEDNLMGVGSSYFIGNIDNEGELDIVEITSSGATSINLKVYTKDNEGNYTSYQESFDGLNSASATMADLDNDGDDDFVGSNNSIIWLQNNNGSFTSFEIFDEFSYVIFPYDVDQDNDNDLVYLTSPPNISEVLLQYIENQGTNDFTQPITIDTLPFTQTVNLPSQTGRQFWLQAQDIDNDNIDDLWVNCDGSDKFVWYRKRNLPVANFSVDFTGSCAPQVVNYSNESTDNATTFNWFFEGGTPSTSNEPNPTVTYNIGGVFSAQLAVEGGEGVDTLIRESLIEVSDVPMGTFEVVSNDEGMVEFMSNIENVDDYFWDFGDGLGNSIFSNPNHFFPFSGTYLVSLSVTNDCGTNVIENEITVNLSTLFTAVKMTMGQGDTQLSTALISAPGIMGSGLMTNVGNGVFTQNLFVPHGDTMFYQFRSLSPFLSEDFSLLENCAIENNDGDLRRFFIAGTDPDEMIVELSFCFNSCEACPTPPTTAFSFTTNMLEATFTDNSTGAESWLWNFGDGATSTEQNPVHTYAADGTYEVCLTASNMVGDSTICDMVTVMVTNTNDLANEVGLLIFPNPTKERLNLSFNHLPQPLEWRIFDLNGQVVKTGNEIIHKESSIDLSNLSTGMYYLQLVDTEGRSFSKKIVK